VTLSDETNWHIIGDSLNVFRTIKVCENIFLPNVKMLKKNKKQKISKKYTFCHACNESLVFNSG